MRWRLKSLVSCAVSLAVLMRELPPHWSVVWKLMLPLGTANTSLDDRGMGAYLVFLMCSSLTHQRRRDRGVREVTDK